MIAQEYAPLARRTLKLLPTFRQHMIHMGLGITGEFGELIDAIKKVFVYGKDYDHTNAIEEVGDVLWYVANLLPELQVDPACMQRSLDRGVEQGMRMQQQVQMWEDFNLPEALLSLNAGVALKCSELPRLDENVVVGTSAAMQYVEQFAGNVGVLCGLMGIDPTDAMQRNIEKLFKRYGDKYSDVAALNRDLGGERAALEGGAA